MSTTKSENAAMCKRCQTLVKVAILLVKIALCTGHVTELRYVTLFCRRVKYVLCLGIVLLVRT
jgi:hypothetical protein